MDFFLSHKSLINIPWAAHKSVDFRMHLSSLATINRLAYRYADILRRLTPRYRRASLLGPQEGFKYGFQMKLSWEGLGVILAKLGRLWGSFSAHFRGLGGS